MCLEGLKNTVLDHLLDVDIFNSVKTRNYTSKCPLFIRLRHTIRNLPECGWSLQGLGEVCVDKSNCKHGLVVDGLRKIRFETIFQMPNIPGRQLERGLGIIFSNEDVGG
ncbi:hypothetical protein XENOCAPTIV_022208 [Xenoophorus captivus]|uniref:Uncharacterized protein n=1 Tax=Xenoophorus captivus TaxID=1517983 RepID=A0ABV0S1U9_9TELE